MQEIPIIKFIQTPVKGNIVKVYMRDAHIKSKFGIVKKIKIDKKENREIAVIKLCDPVPFNKIDFFLDQRKVQFTVPVDLVEADSSLTDYSVPK